MKDKILKLKLELKNLSKKIRIEKSKRCAKNNGYIVGLHKLCQYYRHRHVLYCLARGRKLEQCDSGVGLDMKYVEFMLEAMKEDKKLYVIVDANLPMKVQVVQSAHAVAEFMKNNPNTMWHNGTLVLLKGDVKYGNRRWRRLPYESAEFREPDMKDAITAIAIFGPGVENEMKRFLLV